LDLLRHTKYVLADQFQVQNVDDELVCVVGPFGLADGQFVEVYLRETAESLEMIFYPGLTEVLTLEAMHELREDSAGGGRLFDRHSLRLHPDRLSTTTNRDRLLEDLIAFNEAIVEMDQALRRRIGTI
jgi:hypothetical protein